MLATLADSRLVTVSEGNVEVAHEALLREWPRLREWIEEDTEGRRLRRHITQAATEWDAAGRDQGELYRGARLAAALDWTADHALDVNELEREFVTESREASEKETKRVRRTNRRLRGLLAGVAVLLAAAVAGGIFAAVQRRRGPRRGDGTVRPAPRRPGARRGGPRPLAPARPPGGRDRRLAADPRLPARTRSSAAPLRSGSCTVDGDVLTGIAISPDGKTLAVDASGVGVLFFDARTYAQIGDPLPWPVTGFDQGSLAYSPDGRTLAVGGDHFVRLIDARTREQLAETAVGGEAMRMAFTKDGSQLVVLVAPGSDNADLGGGNGKITIRDAATLEPIGRSIEPDAFVGGYVGSYYASPQFALTPDDRSLITASEDGELAWWDLRSRKTTRTLKIETGACPRACRQPGRSHRSGRHRRWNTARRPARRIHANGNRRAHRGAPTGWLFSPNGKTVVSTNLDKTVTRWDVESATPLETLRGHSNSVQQPVFSPDGRTLYTVSHDGTAIAWDLAGDRRLGRPFTFTNDRKFSSAGYDGHPGKFSPDGRLIAVGLKERGIALWDAHELTPVGAPLLETGGEVKTLAFSPDGRTLAAATQPRPATALSHSGTSVRDRGSMGGSARASTVS